MSTQVLFLILIFFLKNFILFQEKQGEITEDETVRFKSYLLSLGIDDPVTRDSFRNESQFHKSLARQLADFLKQPIEVSG